MNPDVDVDSSSIITSVKDSLSLKKRTSLFNPKMDQLAKNASLKFLRALQKFLMPWQWHVVLMDHLDDVTMLTKQKKKKKCKFGGREF